MNHHKSDTDAERGSFRSGALWKTLALVVILTVSVILYRSTDLPQRVTETMEWIAGRGAIGAAVFVVLYVIATVLALPASLLTMGAGAIYGIGTGFVLVSLGSTFGAASAFVIARYAARGWIARRIESSPKFKALDDGVAEEGWKIVLLTRLSPAFPFNLQNYGYGLTRIPAAHYIAASWAGMIPGTLLYVYLGHAAGSLAQAGAQENGRSPAQWTLLGVGLAATIAVTVLVTRLARRKLAAVQEHA